MSRRGYSKVVTANDLIEGDAVWLTADGRWSRDISEAELLTEADRAEARLRVAGQQPHLVVGAYLADAEAGPDGPRPVHYREAFRTRGPSNYHHGKQAEA